MVVDIVVKKAPSYRVISLERVGSEGTDPLRREFSELTKWAKSQKIKTGKWIFHFNETGRRDQYRLEACLEIFRKNVEPQGKIKSKTLPPLTVASVKFNPEQVSPRLVYNGVYGWLRENDEGYKSAANYSREIYFGNPWSDSWAWSRAEIQVPVKKSH
jgi:effector-binding domain-containing protein